MYVLDVDGSRVELNDDALQIHGHPSLDGLVLVGSTGGRTWYVALADPGVGSDCFLLASGSAIDEGPTVLFPIDEMYGLRLDKAAEWSVPPPFEMDGDRYPSWLTGWCVNADGEVTSAD